MTAKKVETPRWKERKNKHSFRVFLLYKQITNVFFSEYSNRIEILNVSIGGINKTRIRKDFSSKMILLIENRNFFLPSLLSQSNHPLKYH